MSVKLGSIAPLAAANAVALKKFITWGNGDRIVFATCVAPFGTNNMYLYARPTSVLFNQLLVTSNIASYSGALTYFHSKADKP